MEPTRDRRRTPYALWFVPGSAFLLPLRCSRFLVPPSRKQRRSTDAAIAELRQLMAEQRAALDRQARVIEEQGRTLAALQRQVEGPKPSAETPAVAEAQTRVSEGPVSRTAAEPTPDLPTEVVTAGDFPGSIRIPGTESAIKLGGQARMVAVHTLDALGTEDRFITSSIPVGVPRAGEDARSYLQEAPGGCESLFRRT